MSDAGLRAAAEAWLEADPDPSTRAELAGLLAAAETDGVAAEELRHLFDGRLRFGTAGLRAPLGAGRARMNRVVVRSATAAVMATLPAGARVVVAHDARRNSDVFAADAAALVAAAGGEALFLGQAPTPVAAHAVVDRGAQAGVVITASHNPPGDNGYKLYGADGVQIVPPTDAEVEAHMAVSPLPPRQLPAPSGSGAVRHIGPEATERYLAAITRRLQQPPPDGAPGEPVASTSHRRSGEGRNPLSPTEGVPLRVVYTPLHGVGGAGAAAIVRAAGTTRPGGRGLAGRPRRRLPDRGVPQPRGARSVGRRLRLGRRAGCRPGDRQRPRRRPPRRGRTRRRNKARAGDAGFGGGSTTKARAGHGTGGARPDHRRTRRLFRLAAADRRRVGRAAGRTTCCVVVPQPATSASRCCWPPAWSPRRCWA